MRMKLPLRKTPCILYDFDIFHTKCVWAAIMPPVNNNARCNQSQLASCLHFITRCDITALDQVLHTNLETYDSTTNRCSGLFLGLSPANERRRYFVTTSLIGWAQVLKQMLTQPEGQLEYPWLNRVHTDMATSMIHKVHYTEAVSKWPKCFYLEKQTLTTIYQQRWTLETGFQDAMPGKAARNIFQILFHWKYDLICWN